MRRSRKNLIFDSLHKSVVSVCVAFTAVGTVFLIYQGYQYITHIRPMHQEALVKYEQELLKEGKPIGDTKATSKS